MIDKNIKIGLFEEEPFDVSIDSDEFKRRYEICKQKYEKEIIDLDEFKEYISTKCTYQPQRHVLTIFAYIPKDKRLLYIIHYFEDVSYKESYRNAIFYEKDTVETLISLIGN